MKDANHNNANDRPKSLDSDELGSKGNHNIYDRFLKRIESIGSEDSKPDKSSAYDTLSLEESPIPSIVQSPDAALDSAKAQNIEADTKAGLDLTDDTVLSAEADALDATSAYTIAVDLIDKPNPEPVIAPQSEEPPPNPEPSNADTSKNTDVKQAAEQPVKQPIKQKKERDRSKNLMVIGLVIAILATIVIAIALFFAGNLMGAKEAEESTTSVVKASIPASTEDTLERSDNAENETSNAQTLPAENPLADVETSSISNTQSLDRTSIANNSPDAKNKTTLDNENNPRPQEASDLSNDAGSPSGPEADENTISSITLDDFKQESQSTLYRE